MHRFLYVFFFFFFPAITFCAIPTIPYTIVSKIPHEPPAFTQGLKIVEDQLYESTGLYGQSSLKRIDIKTGNILEKSQIPSKYYGEGIACFPSKIVQLTWKEEIALIYERATLQFQGTISFNGHGWGLCRDNDTIWMSDGSPTITQRDPKTFAILRHCQVTMDLRPVYYINDLECVSNDLYANILFKDYVIRLDKLTGAVNGVIDFSSLLTREEKTKLGTQEVLNGIGFRSKTNTFFVTGKNWPWIFEIRLL